MKENITQICSGYKRIDEKDQLGFLLKPFYTEKDPIVVMASSWKMVHKKKSSIAVLLCHGYSGYPGEMVYTGLSIYNEGFDAYCVRLPGHGTSKREFLKQTSDSWLEVNQIALKYLQERYEKIYLVGHSMGSLSAIILAKQFKIEKLVLIAPATDIIGFNSFKIRIGKILKKTIDIQWKSDKAFFGICERDEKDDEYLGSQLWSHIFPSSLIELAKLKKIANKNLKNLKSDTLFILGTKDRTISIKALKRFKAKKNGNNKSILIEDAGHLVLYSKNSEIQKKCNEYIVKWLLKK